MPPNLLFVWGINDGGSGQLGLGTTAVECNKPRRHLWVEEMLWTGGFGPLVLGAGLVDVAAGGMHSLLLDENGIVWSSGVNDDGALGRVTEGVRDPTQGGSFIHQDIVSCSFRRVQTLVDEGFHAVQIAAGDNIGAAVSGDGDLRVWGAFRHGDGECLFSDGISHQRLPVSVLKLTRKLAGNVERFASVACGDNHIIALTTHGNVYTWGDGDDGRLGRRILTRHKSLTQQRVEAIAPRRIVLGPGTRSRKAVLVSSGKAHSFAVDDSGGVWAWGTNTTGQTGTGYAPEGKLGSGEMVDLPTRVIGLTPAELGPPERVVSIAAGDFHTLFLTSEGEVYACGQRGYGCLGLPDEHEAFQESEHGRAFISTPALVEFHDKEPNDPIVSIAAGPRYSMAITQDGILYSWGFGPQGELGLGEGIEQSNQPRKVTRREGSWAVRKVSCGGQHAIGLFEERP
ncbi:hypothetical protein PM082_017668 [Marasmius tenuissimus]|nr:hypothetical protein PM082_017668 [Marasmius tenuissimus]